MTFRAMLPRSSRCVTLRPLEHRDATAYAAGAADPDVRRLAYLPEPEYTPGRVRELIDTTVEEGLSSGTLAVLALADAATDDFLGSMVIFDVTVDSAEVGFWVAPAGRGRGVAAAGLRLACDLARARGMTHLRARTDVDNAASRTVLERAGFRPVGAPAPGTTPSGAVATMQEYVAAV